MSQTEFWLYQGAIVIGFVAFVVWIVIRLKRRDSKNRQIAMLWVCCYIISSACAIGYGMMAIELVAIEERMKRPSPIKPISTDWGEKLNVEKRTEQSLALAKSVFESSGEIFNFIDKSGRLTPFEPSQIDRTNREMRNVAIAVQAKYSVVAAVIWLFVPLVISGFILYGRLNSGNSKV